MPGVGDPSSVATKKKKTHDPKAVAIGQRIKKTREARGMKQTELAKAAGVRPHSLWRNEVGENEPNSETLDAYAEALGVPSRWLLRGGVVPPGLPVDDEGQLTRPVVETDPPITQDQERELLDETDASPQLRACWGLHRQGTGAYQRITRVYMSRFLEVGQQELDANVSIEVAVERAGEYAFNAAVEAHRAAASGSKKKKRSKAKR